MCKFGSFFLLLSFFLFQTITLVLSDTPANCTYDDLVGSWVFYEGSRGHSANVACSSNILNDLKHESRVNLLFPDVAVDQFGNEGRFTIIYNQGFEVTLNNRKYFAFSNWSTTQQHKVISKCHETKIGWSHDVYVRDWSCFFGLKVSRSPADLTKVHVDRFASLQGMKNGKFKNNMNMISKINYVQSSWKAVAYPEWETMTQEQVLMKLGGVSSRFHKTAGMDPKPKLTRMAEKFHQSLVEDLPLQFDWRNHNGQNFVSPVRNQGSCGSCYAFASMALLEARYRILTNNTKTPVFSPQDVVQCSEYAQGCAGGFPYLIGGKYAEDFGVVEESCNPYSLPEPPTGQCNTQATCRRYYATGYHYVGGYYGAGNEPLMRQALVTNGPLAVGFEVYADFATYKSGIYHHTGVVDNVNRLNKWDPFQLTNHAVLIVGYGADPSTGELYWTVKNSWGTGWGEEGYFKIRRGNDECGIESLAVEAQPIPTY